MGVLEQLHDERLFEPDEHLPGAHSVGVGVGRQRLPCRAGHPDNWHEAAAERWRDALLAAGVDVTWIDLPARGIAGNSHALMCDDNSDDLAGLVLGWMSERGLVSR